MQVHSATRRRIPSLHVRTLLISMVFATIFSLNIFGFADPDFWWHVRTGQYIVETRSIPTTDSFSYTASGQPWITHEWAAEVLMFLLFQALGYAGAVLVFASVVTLSFFLVFRFCRKLGVHELVAILLTFWGALLALPHLTVRPLVFTWFFFAVFLMSLYLYHRGMIRRLWHLPVLMLLWVNLHGGFAIGFALIGLLLAARLGEALFLRKPLAVRHPLTVLGLSGLAALANPNGLAGLSYPLTYFGSTNPFTRFIVEWGSPDFRDPYLLLLVGSFLLLMGLGVANRELGIWPLLLTASLVTMALQSVRHVPLYALAAVPIAGEALRFRFGQLGRQERRPIPPALGRSNWLILLLLIATLAALVVSLPNSQLRETPQFRRIAYPAEGVSYVRLNYPQTRIFNDYTWGGYLIYALPPTQRVFIDGRTDLYGSALLKDYNDVVNLRPNWEEVLDRYNVDLVFVERDSPLSVLLASNPSWRKVFSGQIEDIFVRSRIWIS